MATRYFKTFSSITYPVTPLHEIEKSAAVELNAYYEAIYRSDGRLERFIKHLRELQSNEQPVWIIMFTELYEYWPNGRLKQRKLVSRDGDQSAWEFADKPALWSGFLDSFLGKWFSKFSRKSSRSTIDLADCLITCEEVLTEMEAQLFEGSATLVRDRAWAVGEITGQVDRIKSLVLELVPRSSPRLSFIVSGENSEGEFLEGFDELFNAGPLWELLDPLFETADLSPCGSFTKV